MCKIVHDETGSQKLYVLFADALPWQRRIRSVCVFFACYCELYIYHRLDYPNKKVRHDVTRRFFSTVTMKQSNGRWHHLECGPYSAQCQKFRPTQNERNTVVYQVLPTVLEVSAILCPVGRGTLT